MLTLGIFYVSCIRISDPSFTCLVDDRAKFPVKIGNVSKIQPCHAHFLHQEIPFFRLVVCHDLIGFFQYILLEHGSQINLHWKMTH